MFHLLNDIITLSCIFDFIPIRLYHIYIIRVLLNKLLVLLHYACVWYKGLITIIIVIFGLSSTSLSHFVFQFVHSYLFMLSIKCICYYYFLKCVVALPGPPTNIQVSDITATSVRLTWSYPSEDLQYYVITYKPKYANQAFSEISGIITMHYTVRSLSPYTEYEMYVIAVNNIGRGPPSAPVIVTTGETGEVAFPSHY